jgi:cell division protein FtsQ
MGIKKNIRKVIFICSWLIAGAGVIVLLVAAMNSRNHQVCKGYDIDINGKEKGQWFVDKNDIINVLTQNKTIGIKNKKIESFDLNRLESRLEKEVWIKDAELYFDNTGVLKIKVKEREPVARIFSSMGESFYIDSTGHRLPLSDKMSTDLPVFTGFPNDGKKIKTVSDKKLVRQIKELSLFLLHDPFWMAHVSQIDITPAREFEIIPVVGNHIVEFGDATNKEEKFRRLLIFYKQVLSTTGMDKYNRIKVQYDNQVIGVKDQKNTTYNN